LKWEKVIEAGIKLSVTCLSNSGREGSMKHAKNGELLSAMDPNFVGALTVMLIPARSLRGLPQQKFDFRTKRNCS